MSTMISATSVGGQRRGATGCGGVDHGPVQDDEQRTAAGVLGRHEPDRETPRL